MYLNKIYEKYELEAMEKEDLVNLIYNLQEEFLSVAIYDAKTREVSTELKLKMFEQY